MNNFPTKEEVARLRAKYPPGTRLELTAPMDDPYTPIPAGTRGFCRGVDDAGHIMMSWDCRSSLSLIPGVDHFRTVPYISDELLAEIKAVQMSGETNMLDSKAVFGIAVREGYNLLADFIFTDTKRYSAFILTGIREVESE